MSNTVLPPTSASFPARRCTRWTIVRASLDSTGTASVASTSWYEPSVLRTGAATRAIPGIAVSCLASPCASPRVRTCTGAPKPGPVSCCARSVASRTSAFLGSSSSPRLYVCIQKNGTESTTITPAPAVKPVTGRRITRRAHPLQNASLPASVVRHGNGSRNRSTRGPTTESRAGSSVIEASTERQTTTIAPSAMERSAFTSIVKSAASETATASPLKTTAVPELDSARESAAAVVMPRCSSRRKRLTMKSE